MQPIYDQHLHTDLSFDSAEPMEAYAQKVKAEGGRRLITTEHLDLDPVSFPADIIPDFIRQRRQIAQLSAAYDLDILYGVEAGYRPDHAARIAAILQSQPFDLVLLSMHETKTVDYYAPSGRAQFASGGEMYAHYLDRVEEMLYSFYNYDVLAHIDYGMRKAGPIDLAPHYPALRRIFTKLARDGKALELNGRLVTTYGTLYHRQFAQLFLECGGLRFTLGSDGHAVSAHQEGFGPLVQLLQSLQVPGIWAYRQRKGELLQFEE